MAPRSTANGPAIMGSAGVDSSSGTGTPHTYATTLTANAPSPVADHTTGANEPAPTRQQAAHTHPSEPAPPT